MLTSIAYFDLYNYKKLKKVEAFYNRYNRQVLHFMYMQRKEFMKEMDMLIIYMFILLMTLGKTYDRTEYFKIKDQIRENMVINGYHDNNWCWIIYR
jgi:hypothetical protein